MNKYNSESLTLLMELPLERDISKVDDIVINNYTKVITNYFIRLPESPNFNNGDLFLEYGCEGKIRIHITPRTQEEMWVVFNANNNSFGEQDYKETDFFKLGKIKLNSWANVVKPDKKLYSRYENAEGKMLYNEVVILEFTNASYIEITFNCPNDFEISMKEFVTRSFKEEKLEPILQLIKDRLKEYVGVEEYEVKK